MIRQKKYPAIRKKLVGTANHDPSGAASDWGREPVARAWRGFSFVLTLRLLLALSSNWVALFMRWVVFVFSFFGKLFAFALTSRQAINCCLPDISTLTAMAQMKPNSSRPTAVMIFLCSFPAADSLT
jgi:hypothetical protein